MVDDTSNKPGSSLAPASDARTQTRLQRTGREPAPVATETKGRRIALAHDWLCGYRGGEAVLDRLSQLVQRHFEAAGLYVMVDDGRPLTPAIDRLRHITSPLQRIPGAAGRLRRWMLPLYQWAVERLSRQLAADHARQPIDLLISTSSAAIKGLRPPPGVPHLCYCHSPARYVWSQQEEYSRGEGIASGLRALGLRMFAGRFKRWDRATSANVSHFIANSTHTEHEIMRCFGRASEVVHPPVRTEYFTSDPNTQRERFWLAAGAMEPYKRFDLAILAAEAAGHELMVVGGGSQRTHLTELAARIGANVRFHGRVDDMVLRDLYRRAAVLIFPQVEDFGITAVEAQACGLPVLALARGGALDTVIDGRTGILVDEPTPSAFGATGEVLSERSLSGVLAGACRENAERFSEAAFDERMLRVIRGALGSRERA